MSNDYCDVCNRLKKRNTKDYAHDCIEGMLLACPFVCEDWHKQAEAIHRQIKKTPSRRLADLMQEELTEIICTKIATKDMYK